MTRDGRALAARGEASIVRSDYEAYAGRDPTTWLGRAEAALLAALAIERDPETLSTLAVMYRERADWRALFA